MYQLKIFKENILLFVSAHTIEDAFEGTSTYLTQLKRFLKVQVLISHNWRGIWRHKYLSHTIEEGFEGTSTYLTQLQRVLKVQVLISHNWRGFWRYNHLSHTIEEVFEGTSTYLTQLKRFLKVQILILHNWRGFWRYKHLSYTTEEISMLLFYKPDPYFTSVIIINFFIHIFKSVRLATRKVERNTAKISPQSNERANRRATPTTHDTLHFLKDRNSGLNTLTFFFCCGAATQRGSWPFHSRGF
jgi:hypothetical protein